MRETFLRFSFDSPKVWVERTTGERFGEGEEEGDKWHRDSVY